LFSHFAKYGNDILAQSGRLSRENGGHYTHSPIFRGMAGSSLPVILVLAQENLFCLITLIYKKPLVITDDYSLLLILENGSSDFLTGL
jgi:tetrahydromethanopterin S-methyltransferase subunit E